MTAPKLPEGLEPVALPQPIGYLAFQVDDAKPVFFPSMPVLLAGTARWHPGVARVVPVHHADDLHQAQAALQALAAEKDAEIAALTAIKQAISDYHYALDTRQHGGVAQNRAFSAICTALGMQWILGAEKECRAAIDSAPRAVATQEINR
jgi:hypothetical protein